MGQGSHEVAAAENQPPTAAYHHPVKCPIPPFFITVVYTHPKANAKNAPDIISMLLALLASIKLWIFVMGPSRNIQINYDASRRTIRSQDHTSGSSLQDCIKKRRLSTLNLWKCGQRTLSNFYETVWSAQSGLYLPSQMELPFNVCSYIAFCEQTVIPTWQYTLYPNNKPWSLSPWE